MQWTGLVAVIVVLAAFKLLKKSGEISAARAQELLKNGARVLDVRTSGEFRSGHLKKAVNLPLDEIEALIEQTVKDKNQALLLHCQSGIRSGMAARKLNALGYTNVHNLGSYQRAASMVED